MANRPLYPNAPKGWRSAAPSLSYPTQGVSQQFGSAVSVGYKRLLATLALVALLLGIAAEGISIIGGYFNAQKTSYEATSARVKALSATCNPFERNHPGCQ